VALPLSKTAEDPKTFVRNLSAICAQVAQPKEKETLVEKRVDRYRRSFMLQLHFLLEVGRKQVRGPNVQ
jgi:hypothetical protein